MAVERTTNAPKGYSTNERDDEELGPAKVVENEDGSVEVEFGGEDEEEMEVGGDFYQNLVEVFDEDKLKEIATTVIEGYKADLDTRQEWEETITKGLQLLGTKIEELEEPFPGACSAIHPLLLESASKFQAKASGELLPANGPVKCRIVGARTPARDQRASRIKNHLNWMLTDEMEEFYPEMERMFFIEALYGTALKKTYYDEHLERANCVLVPPQRFVIDNSFVDLRKAPRYTEVIYKSESEMAADVESGFYAEVEIGEPQSPQLNEIDEKEKEVLGFTQAGSEYDSVYTLLEQHVMLAIEGDEDDWAPYVVTVDYESEKVLSIRRNWKEGDKKKRKNLYYTDYHFVRGFGFYSLGYIHLIGNFQLALTTILRSLVDSGQFANLQGGFRLKGTKLGEEDGPLAFGEWREAEASNMDLTKSLFPIKYNEPSQVLFQLYQQMEARAQKFADSVEQVVGDASTYGPVGTVMALLEASSKFYGAIFKRQHESLKRELKKIAAINAVVLPQVVWADEAEGVALIYRDDYMDAGIAIQPVSDPNVSSQSHRMALAQVDLQMAQQFPQVHDMRQALQSVYLAMGKEQQEIDRILPPPLTAQPSDPLTDIMDAAEGRPIKAFPGQDHQAHIQVKTAYIQMAGQQTPQVAAILSANVQEHIVTQFAEQIQGAMDQNVVQQAGEEVAQAQAAQMLQQAMQNYANAKDPMATMAEAEVLKARAQKENSETRRIEAVIDAMLKMQELKQEDRMQQFKEMEAGLKIQSDAENKEADRRMKFLLELIKKEVESDQKDKDREVASEVKKKSE